MKNDPFERSPDPPRIYMTPRNVNEHECSTFVSRGHLNASSSSISGSSTPRAQVNCKCLFLVFELITKISPPILGVHTVVVVVVGTVVGTVSGVVSTVVVLSVVGTVVGSVVSNGGS